MVTAEDRKVLRHLARHVADIAALPVQGERRELWVKHNSLQPAHPMILVFPEGAWQELLPDAVLQCEGAQARRIEWTLRSRIYCHDHFLDDTVIEKQWIVHKTTHHSGSGMQGKRVPSPDARGAWRFDPVIHEPSDLGKLCFPENTYDEAATQRALGEAQDLFGDILNVKLKGQAHLSYHLMNQYTALRRLEQVMIDMYDAPQMLHDAMAFLEEGHHGILKQYVDLNLLSLNNDGTYQSSGGKG